MGDKNALEQAKALAYMYAHTHSNCSFITVDSEHDNLLIPVVPRIGPFAQSKDTAFVSGVEERGHQTKSDPSSIKDDSIEKGSEDDQSN